VPLLTIDHVKKIFPEKNGSGGVVIKDFCCEIEEGEFVSILGPSGCGKSTLLELVAGLRQPASGRVRVDDQLVTKPRQGTGYIPQGGGLLPWRDALGNAALGLEIQHTPRAQRLAAARLALETVGLDGRERSFPAELSGGMRQRLALARCLAARCDVILADEPFSALDAMTREQMQAVMLDLWQRMGYTQILVTHSVEEAVWLGGRIVVLTASPGPVHAVVDNPQVGTPGWRGSGEYAACCVRVRELLGQAGQARDADAEVDA
jgi:NitT/TauT family transport system ATP-binding protein